MTEAIEAKDLTIEEWRARFFYCEHYSARFTIRTCYQNRDLDKELNFCREQCQVRYRVDDRSLEKTWSLKEVAESVMPEASEKPRRAEELYPRRSKDRHIPTVKGSKTEQLLTILRDKGPMTVEEMGLVSGVAKDAISGLLNGQKRKGVILGELVPGEKTRKMIYGYSDQFDRPEDPEPPTKGEESPGLPLTVGPDDPLHLRGVPLVDPEPPTEDDGTRPSPPEEDDNPDDEPNFHGIPERELAGEVDIGPAPGPPLVLSSKGQLAANQLARSAVRAFDVEKAGQLTTQRRVAAGARSEVFLAAMIQKFPDFDGTWEPEIQTKWWEGYWRLLGMAEMEEL